MSVNTEYSIIDAGSKMMSSDLAPHSADGISGYGMVFALEDYNSKKEPKILAKLSEEHGLYFLYIYINRMDKERAHSITSPSGNESLHNSKSQLSNSKSF